jgi:DtxR family Mn-dependent transcriptional regulator
VVVEGRRRSAFSQAQEDCLKALFYLQGHERTVPTSDLAQRLGISSPSVTEMVGRLASEGLVEHDRYRGQRLTESGHKVALELVRHHRLLEMFLVRTLGYGWDEVHEEAERLEHVISERLEERIFQLLGRPELDPHGHAIPTREGKVRPVSKRPLSECIAGEEVTVEVVSDEDADRLRELERRHLVPGARLKVISGTQFESPIEAELGRRRISVPLGLARSVFVEKVKA